MSKKRFTINSRKADGAIHRSWKADFIAETNDCWLFTGIFSQPVNHSKLGFIRRYTISYEYYWKDKYFNVFRFHEPEGELRNFYCNINLPPKVSDDVLDYVDLDVDVLVNKDLSFEILDVDEYEENSKLFNYSVDLKIKVQSNLNELLQLIENRKFPFDFTERKLPVN